MTVWQQLGAFTVTTENLGDKVERFAAVGGRWIVPVIYNDDASGPRNRELLPALQARCGPLGVTVGGWFNVFGSDPHKDADAIQGLARKYGLRLIIIDAEAAYQHPEGNAGLLPALMAAVRLRLPNADIGLSTNSLNAAMIYNGRTLERGPRAPLPSFWRLGIRVLPQWYNAPRFADSPWSRADTNMLWLKQNGHLDGNFRDPDAPYERGVPLSYVHGTLEVTGVEGASLLGELVQLDMARGAGFTKGFSLYDLEHMRPDDFALVQRFRALYVA